MPSVFDPEDTKVVVERHRRATRNKRLITAAVVALFGGGALFWALNAQKSCSHMQHGGKIERGGRPAARKSWVVNPGSPTARVHITIDEPAEVFVDDKSLGTLEFGTFELRPGEHTIRAVINRTEMQQLMTVKAGEEFKVLFDRGRKKIDLQRVPPSD